MAGRGSGRDMRRDMDTIRASHSHLVGFYGNSRNEEERRGENWSWEMNTNSYSGYRDSYTDPNSSSYSVTANYGLYKQLDQMATMMSCQQEAISKFLKENEGIKSTLDTVKEEIGSLRKELAEITSDAAPLSGATTPLSHKLDTKLTAAVRKLHQEAENQFDGSKLYNDNHNKTVSSYLMEELAEKFDQKQIKRAVHRYYESRRRQYIDSKPERVAIKEQNDKKTKLRSRQKQLYDRRFKLCQTKQERKHWKQIDETYMTEESDDGEGSFRTHSPSWRSPKLDDFIQELDSREKRKNLFKKSRKQSTPLEGNAPKDAPTWAIQKQQTSSPESTPAVSHQNEHEPLLGSSPSENRSYPLHPISENCTPPRSDSVPSSESYTPGGGFSESFPQLSQDVHSSSSLSYVTPFRGMYATENCAPCSRGQYSAEPYAPSPTGVHLTKHGAAQLPPVSQIHRQVPGAPSHYESSTSFQKSSSGSSHPATSANLGGPGSTPVRHRINLADAIISDDESDLDDSD